MPSRSARQLAAALESLTEWTAESSQQLLREALASGDARLVTRVAKLATEHSLSALLQPMAAAYQALSGSRAHADSACLAKEALLEALEALEHQDAELFAQAAAYVQLEQARGGTRDVAARVRARGLLSLARLGHADMLPIFGAALADRDASVRLSAARAIGHRGQREAAGLLLLRLGAGESQPEIASECLRALFMIAADLGLRYARNTLQDSDELAREHTLHALGTAPSDAAVELLSDELARCSLGSERASVIQALGLSVRPGARSLLIELVQGDSRSDAEAALSALAIHRYDTRLSEQLQKATAHSRELSQRYRALYLATPGP